MSAIDDGDVILELKDITKAYSGIVALKKADLKLRRGAVNVLVGGDFATFQQLADLGVRRISVGGALARAAWTGFLAAAEEIAQAGTFSKLGRAITFDAINERFTR